jgi:tripartite-type tricarboxylate transporter receptor subunit TctC
MSAKLEILNPFLPRLLAGCAFALGLGFAPAAHAQDVAAFYRGKTVEMIVGASAGGTYDAYARALTRHLATHIPGAPGIVVKNMPGAGSVVAARHLYIQAPKDGTVIGTIMRGAVMEPLLGEVEKAHFDSRKFQWLASASTANGATCIARTDAKVKDFSEVFTKELIVGASARGSAIGDMPRYINNLLKTKFKIVSGYNGTPDTIIAFERGELEGICGLEFADLPRQIPSYNEGKVKVLVQIGMSADPELKKLNVPEIWDFLKNPADRIVGELIFAQLEFGRPFVAPPNVPQERVTALRRAFDETFKDPRFLADIEKLKLELDPRTGEQVQALIEKIFASPPELVQRAREIVQ